MMCRKPARAATTALLAAVLVAGSAEAHGLFGSKPAAPAPATTAKPAGDAKPAAPHKASPAERTAAERMEPLARAAFWGHESSLDPTDAEAALHLSMALRTLARYDDAAEATDRILVLQPADEEMLLEAGRVRIAADKGFYAIAFLERAATAAPRDWRPLSLQGIAMEQTKRTPEARAMWARALQLSPDNPAVLSNLALSYAAAGDRAQAETLLRRAVAQPSATLKERQNLALVLGLSGRVGEAETLIRHDLPPEVADANLAYLKAASAN